MYLISIVFLLFAIVSAKTWQVRNATDDQVAIEDVENNQEIVVVKDLSKNNESYWTQENLNKVKPYPSPTVKPTAKHTHYHYEHADNVTTSTDPKSNRFTRASTDMWTPTEVTGAKPAPLPILSDTDLAALGIKPMIKTKSFRNLLSSVKVEPADVSDSTFKPMGKLLFVDNQGDHYQCSGQYVSDYIVMTAGHCVYSVETDGWNKNFRFIQNYVGKPQKSSRFSSLFSSSRPYEGTPRRVAKAIVGKKWFSEGKENFAYDFAFLAMKDPSIGGFYNIDYPESYDSWINAGYPSNYDKGELLKKYAGKKGTVTENVIETPGNPMGPGCSGGAWIAEKKYAVGVNSFSIVGRESMFSPHFEAKRIQAVLDRAKAVLSASQT